MVPLVVTTLSNLDPSAQIFLRCLADVACSNGVADHGSWLRIAQQNLNCALIRGRGYFQSMAEGAGTDFRDGAVVPFECTWMILDS